MSAHELGDAPIQDAYRAKMQAIAEALDEMFNGAVKGPERETGFVLLVYPFGQVREGDAHCNFISNGADRKDVACLFKEMIARFEGQPELPAGHG